MPSPDGRGYILPVNPSPEGLRCITLFIPDDDLYLSALHGAYYDLTKWQAWEKDGTTRARQAGETWRDAYFQTMDCAWDKGIFMPCIDPIIIEKIALALEAIANNASNGGTNMGNNCGCGCGCGCGSDETPLDPGDEILPPPTPVDDPTQPSAAWKCDASHQIVDYWIEYWDRTLENTNAGLPLIDALAEALTGVGFVTGSTAIFLIIVNYLAGRIVAPFVTSARDWYSLHSADLVCILNGSLSPLQAKSQVVNYTNQVPPSGFVGTIAKSLLLKTYDMSDWNKLFIEDSFVIESNNVGSSCAGCGSPPSPPDPGGEPTGEQETMTGLLFDTVDVGGVLSDGGGVALANGEAIVSNYWYGARSRYVEGSTASAHRVRIVIGVDEEFDPALIDNLKLVITDSPGHSGIAAGYTNIIQAEDRNGTSYWFDLDLPIEIVGSKHWRVRDTVSEFDLWFYFDYWT